MGIAFALIALVSAIALDYLYRHRVVVEFGLLKSDPVNGDIVHVPTTRIPFRKADEALRFGIRFYKRGGRAFRAKVVHILPGPPSTLGGDLGQGELLSDGRCRVDSKEQEYIGGGVRALRLSEGDPLGRYELLLYFNGKLRKTLQYHVVEDAS
jgi:hypothetical protein